LELALRSYAERKEGVVVDPVVGTSFDSLGKYFLGCYFSAFKEWKAYECVLIYPLLHFLQAGVVLRLNVPIERHASKVYTRAMFEQFGDALYKSGAYELQELEKARVFLAEHVDAASREKWCKVAYRVEVEEDLSFLTASVAISSIQA
jgi:hypothetical protein